VPAAKPGRWIWTWIWTRGDGWTTSYTSDLPCSCTWVWTWNWTWGAPAGTSSDNGVAPTPVDAPEITQTNSATAAATASTSFSAESAAAPALGSDDGASVVSSQDATATAIADQTRPDNFIFISAGALDTLTQKNEAAALADARAAFEAFQAIGRTEVGEDDGAVHETAVHQTIVNRQSVLATATSRQIDTLNVTKITSQTATQAPIGAVDQENVATSEASAAAKGDATQTASQALIPAGEDQTAETTQAISNAQGATASAASTQTRVGNVANIDIPERGISNPKLAQSNKAATTAGSLATSSISQDALQVAAGKYIEWHEVVTQDATVKQSGLAEDLVSQGDHFNVSGWRGLIAPLPVPQQVGQAAKPLAGPAGPAAAAGGSGSPASSAPVQTRSLTSTSSTSGALAFRPHSAKKAKKTAPRHPKAAHRSSVRHAHPQVAVTRVPAKATKATHLHPLFERAPRHAPHVLGGASHAGTSTFISLRPSFGTIVRPTLRVAAIDAGSAPWEANARGSAAGSTRSSGGGPDLPGPGCTRCPGGVSLTGFTSGASGYGFAGVVAALTARFSFAAPGAGWPHVSAPALGRPVDTAPFERPG
jgi:hypothetical protein